MTVGIAAAGSGGHVYPALAVAEVLVSRGLEAEDIIFFGGDRMEADVIPGAGYRFRFTLVLFFSECSCHLVCEWFCEVGYCGALTG